MSRQGVSEQVAKSIQRRLDDFLQQRYKSRYAFMEGYPATEAIAGGKRRLKDPAFSRKTVDAWFRGNRIPDAPSILRLADVARLSPSFLLLGEGDALRGVSTSPRALGLALREKVYAELRSDWAPVFVDDVLGDPEEVLADVVAWYRERARALQVDREVRFKRLTVDAANRQIRELQAFVRRTETPG